MEVIMKRLDGKKYLVFVKLKVEFAQFWCGFFVGAQNVLAEEMASTQSSESKLVTTEHRLKKFKRGW